MCTSVLGCVCKRIDSTVGDLILQSFVCSLRICQGQDCDLVSILNHLGELISRELRICVGFFVPCGDFLGMGVDRVNSGMQKTLLNLEPSINAEWIPCGYFPELIHT